MILGKGLVGGDLTLRSVCGRAGPGFLPAEAQDDKVGVSDSEAVSDLEIPAIRLHLAQRESPLCAVEPSQVRVPFLGQLGVSRGQVAISARALVSETGRAERPIWSARGRLSPPTAPDGLGRQEVDQVVCPLFPFNL